MFVFKTAKREADYLDAAREYERAVASAPWVASYYADLCTIYEKAGKYAEAKRACDFALVGTTDSSQAINPRAAIVQLTAQLKDKPDDTSTRRLIIKLASGLKPAPAIPEEARKHFVEGTAIVKAAKNPAQQALAAQSFGEALKVAPWWGMPTTTSVSRKSWLKITTRPRKRLISTC